MGFVDRYKLFSLGFDIKRRILTIVVGLGKEVLNKLISMAIMLTVKRALNGWIKFGVSLGSLSLFLSHTHTHVHTHTLTRRLTWKLSPLSGWN